MSDYSILFDKTVLPHDRALAAAKMLQNFTEILGEQKRSYMYSDSALRVAGKALEQLITEGDVDPDSTTFPIYLEDVKADFLNGLGGSCCEQIPETLPKDTRAIMFYLLETPQELTVVLTEDPTVQAWHLGRTFCVVFVIKDGISELRHSLDKVPPKRAGSYILG
ncbi:hypothetical protein BB559_002153 [Furculomyces boomerangus]|uniref:Uncharacterized protein n=1 Tax=Furculomyces boomerangus TaxID=61424 RepID=A0A2T9YXN8_9FUNG|nr:hypothetical protein BB559_002153 [Furculomyces boomerangus]